MISTTQTLQALLGAVTWESLAGLVLRATLVAGLGHLALLLLRRSAAATRHLVALAALAAVVALPLATAVVPRHATWTLTTTLLPPAPIRATELAADGVATEGAIVEAGAPRVAPLARSDAESARTARRLEKLAPPATMTESASPAIPPRSPADDATAPLPQEARPAGILLPPATPWPGWIAAVALLVAAVLLARLAAGMIAAGWSARRAETMTEPETLRSLGAACRRLGIGNAVSLKLDPRLAVPVVTGLFRPTLLIPGDALAWPAERLRAVFLHELAHVRRGDVVGLVLGRAATALFWFHPLVWTLARAARAECERACDDVVLSSGLRASDYADHLVAIARAAAGPGRSPGAALAFARRSSLEGRLLSLLRAGVPRGPASARARWAVGAALPCLLAGLCSLQVVAAPRVELTRGYADQALVAPMPPAIAGQGLAEIVADGRALSTWSLEAAEQDDVASDTWSGEVRSKQEDQAERHEKQQQYEKKKYRERDHKEERYEKRESQRAVVAESRSAASRYSEGKELYDAERFEQAGAAFQAAAEGGHRPAAAWYNAACSYARAGQRLRALAALQEATRAGFDDLGHLRSDDDLESIRGDSRFRLLVESLRSSESNLDARRSAREHYETLRSARSRDANEWKSAGVALMRSGEDALAAEAFARQAALDASPSAIYNQACALALEGQCDRAIATLERAIVAGYGSGEKLRSDPDLFSLRDDPRLAELARLADDLTLKFVGKDDDPGAWRATVKRYERVARERPDLGRAWFNLGFAQLRARDPRGSRESFSRALDLDYRQATTTYNLACAAAQAGDADEALRWLARSEAAGMELEQIAPQDDDLDPLHSDRRFRALVERWEQQRQADKAAKHKEREKHKDKEKDKNKS